MLLDAKNLTIWILLIIYVRNANKIANPAILLIVFNVIETIFIFKINALRIAQKSIMVIYLNLNAYIALILVKLVMGILIIVVYHVYPRYFYKKIIVF